MDFWGHSTSRQTDMDQNGPLGRDLHRVSQRFVVGQSGLQSGFRHHNGYPLGGLHFATPLAHFDAFRQRVIVLRLPAALAKRAHRAELAQVWWKWPKPRSLNSSENSPGRNSERRHQGMVESTGDHTPFGSPGTVTNSSRKCKARSQESAFPFRLIPEVPWSEPHSTTVPRLKPACGRRSHRGRGP